MGRNMGRKRHALVDTFWLILAVVVHPADVQDDDGAKPVLGRIRGRSSRPGLGWADGIYERVISWLAAWRAAKPIRL